jgi:hypothetical protein
MTIAVALRGDFKASQLRGLARKTKDGPQARRLLAVAAIYDRQTPETPARPGPARQAHDRISRAGKLKTARHPSGTDGQFKRSTTSVGCWPMAGLAPRSGKGRHMLLLYMNYHNEVRTHLSLEKDAPVSRAIELAGRILCRPILGGLHHQYIRI